VTLPASLEGGSRRVQRPRFTIVTSSFNQAHFLAETIQSVRQQGRDDVEHLVLDGGSTDGSVEVLRANDGALSYWVSAKDDGQPSAWNAGVRRARGEIVGFINSDDLLLPGALDEIARLADTSPDAEWFVGGTKYFGEGAPPLSYAGTPQRSAADVLFFASYAPQPGQFFKRSLIERVGGFDESLQYSFDLDFFVRCALAGARSVATPRIVAAFRFHGASKTVSQAEKHLAETRFVEARHWPAVLRREGRRAQRVRADYLGHKALERSRDALAAGSRADGWKLLAGAVREFPSMLGTRAFLGTVQRLLGLRH
jgi:GT2 family glycosyltransferase